MLLVLKRQNSWKTLTLIFMLLIVLKLVLAVGMCADIGVYTVGGADGGGDVSGGVEGLVEVFGVIGLAPRGLPHHLLLLLLLQQLHKRLTTLRTEHCSRLQPRSAVRHQESPPPSPKSGRFS